MVCHLSLGPSHLAALMAAHRMSAARSQAQFDALRRCDGLVRLDRLVARTAGDDCAADQQGPKASKRVDTVGPLA